MSLEILPDILAGQYVPDADQLHLVRRPEAREASVTDVAVAVGDEQKQQVYARRLALVREIDALGRRESWADVGRRHGFSPQMAYWLWHRHIHHGESALKPGKRSSFGLRVWKRKPLLDERGNVVLTPRRRLPANESATGEQHLAVINEIVRLWGSVRPEQKAERGARLAGKGVVALQDHLEAFLERNELRVEYQSLAGFVHRFLKADPKAIAARAGRRYYPPSSGRPEDLRQITDLLQVVCVDATPADVLLASNDGLSVLERVWILYGIDVRSRALWSWLVVRRQPSAASYLKLFARGVLPKDELCAMRRTDNAYPVHGMPQLILADRGMAEASESVRFAALGLNVIVEHAPPLLPQMKGHVERIAGTVARGLLHQLPGTTLSNPLERGGHDAVREALRYGITFDRFEAMFDRAIIDGFMDRVHSALGRSPIEEWDRVASMRRAPRPWS